MSTDLFPHWIKDNQLLQVTRKHNAAGPGRLLGRMISYHEDSKLVLLYIDDEKKVYNLSLDEIESIGPAQ